MGLDLADVDCEHVSGLGAFDVGAAGGCVTAVGGLGVGSVGVVEVSDVVGDEMGVGSTVHLGLDFEPFAGFDVERYGVCGRVFVVEGVSGCGFHGMVFVGMVLCWDWGFG